MKEEDEALEEFRTRLARYFLIAFLANYHDVTFKTAEKYPPKEGKIGELWLALADIAIEHFKEGFSDSDVKEKAEEVFGKVISFGRLD